jgi:hypothetical protein
LDDHALSTKSRVKIALPIERIVLKQLDLMHPYLSAPKIDKELNRIGNDADQQKQRSSRGR